MKIIAKLMLFALALMPLTGKLEAGLLDQIINKQPTFPPNIKVLLVHDREGVMLEVRGKYRLYDPKKYEFMTTRYLGKRKFIQAVSDGLKWGEQFPGIHQLMIVPDTLDIATVVDGKEYQGSIYVYDVLGQIGVVNEIEIEDYLQSVLSSTIRDPLPQEVLAAIAIAARTHAYYFAINPKSPFWAIEASEVNYEGHEVLNPKSPIVSEIISTRYLVMSDSGVNKTATPFPALFGTTGPGVASKISVQEAIAMANKGAHAAQILAKAFPGTTIVLTYTPVD